MMKKKDDHIKAAISAAVMTYIKSEEEIAAVSGLVAAARGSSALERGPFTRANAWGAGGREAQMQLRTLMQLKGFSR